MRLIPTEEQALIAQTAATLFRERAPVARSRALRRGGSPGESAQHASSAYPSSDALWRTFAEMGWLGVHLPEELGGVGLGYRELCALIEQAGHVLAPEPLVSCLVGGVEAIRLGGDASQQRALLASVASGEVQLALADHERGARYRRYRCATRAVRDGDGWRIDGAKAHIPGAVAADRLVVVARVDGERDDRDGLGLFVVPCDAPGVERTAERRIDGRDAASVVFDAVRIETAAVLGDPDGAADVLDAVYDRVAIALSAELLGLAQAAFDMTLAYLKERVQFDVPIGSFQALQHRAARMFTSLELARSSVIAAAAAIDEAPSEVPALAALAKAQCSDTAIAVTQEAVQMHGGIGVTDEHDIGLYLKRARAAAQSCGDAAFWRDRWATLHGY